MNHCPEIPYARTKKEDGIRIPVRTKGTAAGYDTKNKSPRHHPGITASRDTFTKKEDRIPYRSANFSTTRTLSPRTVIGIGTTLS